MPCARRLRPSIPLVLLVLVLPLAGAAPSFPASSFPDAPDLVQPADGLAEAEALTRSRLASATDGASAWMLRRQLAHLADARAPLETSGADDELPARPLGEVLLDLAREAGVALDARQEAETRAIDAAYGEPLASALSVYFDRALDLTIAYREALAAVDADALPRVEGMSGFALALGEADASEDVTRARHAFSDAGVKVQRAVAYAAFFPKWWYGPQLGHSCYLWIIGGASTNVWTLDAVYSMDLGGPDQYYNNAGGTTCDPIKTCAVTGGPTFFSHRDLGLDPDTYGAPWARRDCGVNGGGHYGVGILADQGGDDHYHAGSYGTNGGSYQGVGRLVDIGGHDRYDALGQGSNGGAYFGSGYLKDFGGNDVAIATEVGTNGGGASGAGSFFDLGGRDEMRATDTATNGGSSSGNGMVVAHGPEDDVYEAGSYGTNGGAVYWPSDAYLYDAGGSDKYYAGEAGTNGGGSNYVGSSAPPGGPFCAQGPGGFLHDAGGATSHDAYDARGYGTNGGAFGFQVGFLLDGGGRDSHVAGDAGTNGGANLAGRGCLRALGVGADSYLAGAGGTNGGSILSGAIGALIEDGGADTYLAGAWGNGAAAASAGFGLLLDVGGATGDYYQDPHLPGGSCVDCDVAQKGSAAGSQNDA